MTTRRTFHKGQTSPDRSCALLWDESFIWGLMAWRALKGAGLPFNLLSSEDVREGALSHYRMIFVPGGWASSKLIALGDRGRGEIRRFVETGGSYLGICGGAGLATEEGIGLLSIQRKSTAERVPSFSGSIRISCADHRIWKGIEASVFSAWWPSQFRIGDQNIRTLATYEEAQADAFSADIAVADGRIAGWSTLERKYGILLDPERLRHEPAVVEERCGRGKVILSLIHFDTPGDGNSAVVLRNLWDYLAPGGGSHPQMNTGNPPDRPLLEFSPELSESLEAIKTAVAELIATGIRNFLWHRRNPLLLQWRRGVRGLEYSTLAAMIGEILKRLDYPRSSGPDGGTGLSASMDTSLLKEDLFEIKRQLIPFAEKAKRLLVKERFYMQTTPLSPLDCADAEISRLRQELFSSAMSHGGHFKRLIDAVDRLLSRLLKEA